MLTINRSNGKMGIVYNTYEHEGKRYAQQWVTDKTPTEQEWETLRCGVAPTKNDIEEYEI